YVLSEVLKKPAEALAVLDTAVTRHPESALAYAGRGVLRARAGDYAGAKADAERALGLDCRPLVVYQVAGIYALSAKLSPADRDRAVDLLGRALHHEFGLELVGGDPDLELIRTLPEVQKLLAAARKWKKSSEDSK